MADTDDSGNLLDPEILPDFEARITAAAATGDPAEVEFVQWQYDEARKQRVKDREAFAKARSDDPPEFDTDATDDEPGEDVKLDASEPDVQRSSESQVDNPPTGSVR